jgi:hypothetical protein
MDDYESHELAPFPLEGEIKLEKFGLIKIYRAGDGRLALFREVKYAETTEVTPTNIADIDAALGLVLDVGIKRVRWLTGGGGFYFGEALEPSRPKRALTQADYDPVLFEQLVSSLNSRFQSLKAEQRNSAIQTNFLVQAYNSALLLFPDFYNESYLNLLRIVDTLDGTGKAPNFALFAADVSAAANKEIYEKVGAILGLQPRLGIAAKMFEEIANESGIQALSNRLGALGTPSRFVFSCFYSAYQYRNKFVHIGLPFPRVVRESLRDEQDSGLSYLSSATGLSFLTKYSSGGVGPAELVDFHTFIGQKAGKFKDEYFQLLPSWRFVKRVSREALLKRLQEFRSAQ